MGGDSVKCKEINGLVLANRDGFDRDKIVGVSPLESSSFTVLSSGSKDFGKIRMGIMTHGYEFFT